MTGREEVECDGISDGGRDVVRSVREPILPDVHNKVGSVGGTEKCRESEGEESWVMHYALCVW
jgi:hypothetical protein